jgi:hypothetical protein
VPQQWERGYAEDDSRLTGITKKKGRRWHMSLWQQRAYRIANDEGGTFICDGCHKSQNISGRKMTSSIFGETWLCPECNKYGAGISEFFDLVNYSIERKIKEPQALGAAYYVIQKKNPKLAEQVDKLFWVHKWKVGDKDAEITGIQAEKYRKQGKKVLYND